MTLTTEVSFSKKKTTIVINSLNTQITISDTISIPKKINTSALYLLFNERELLFIGTKEKIANLDKVTITQLIEVVPSDDMELVYLERILVNFSLEQKIPLLIASEEVIPDNINKQLKEYVTAILLVLEKMGYPLQAVKKKKSKPAKARHKWTKEVSEKEFFIDTRSSKATVMWIKRNQMLIKKGATMMKEAPLNKDGSVSFSAKMGDKIRSENLDKFKNFVTTEDIILKSVNEVGLFLYFAGTNSWLEMIDKDGKTLNELTVVE